MVRLQREKNIDTHPEREAIDVCVCVCVHDGRTLSILKIDLHVHEHTRTKMMRMQCVYASPNNVAPLIYIQRHAHSDARLGVSVSSVAAAAKE